MPMPPFQPNAIMPVPAPTHPWPTAPLTRGSDGAAGVLRLDLHGARVVEPAVVAFADDRDHDVVDADCADPPHTRRATAPSKTRPTAIVEVRKTGVSIRPHSEIWRKPVSSPAPFSAGDAGTDRTAEDELAGSGQDRRDAGARDAAAGRRLGLVAHDGDVADARRRGRR